MGRLLSCKLKGRSFVCHGCSVAKRCKIGPRLLLIIDRKWRIGFHMTRKSSTFDDLKANTLGFRQRRCSRPHPSDSSNSCSCVLYHIPTPRHSMRLVLDLSSLRFSVRVNARPCFPSSISVACRCGIIRPPPKISPPEDLYRYSLPRGI